MVKIIPKMVNNQVEFRDLGITEDQIEDLKSMIKNHEEFDDAIEIIITKNLIKY